MPEQSPWIVVQFCSPSVSLHYEGLPDRFAERGGLVFYWRIPCGVRRLE